MTTDTRSSHYLLRYNKVDDTHVLEPERLRQLDDFVEFARNNRQALQCKDPPCEIEHEKMFSLTYLLMVRAKEHSYVMKALDWYIKSNKESIIGSDIEKQPSIRRDLKTTGLNAVRDVTRAITDEHPTTKLYIVKSMAPLQTFIDVLTSLQ